MDLGPLPAALYEKLTSTLAGPEHDATPESDEGEQEPQESGPVELCVVIRILAGAQSSWCCGGQQIVHSAEAAIRGFLLS